jgi:hypothetical protein
VCHQGIFRPVRCPTTTDPVTQSCPSPIALHPTLPCRQG